MTRTWAIRLVLAALVVLACLAAVLPAHASFAVTSLARGVDVGGEPVLRWRADWEITSFHVKCVRRDTGVVSLDAFISSYCEFPNGERLCASVPRPRAPSYLLCDLPLLYGNDGHIHRCQVTACTGEDATPPVRLCGGVSGPAIEPDVTCMPTVPDGGCPNTVLPQP